MTTNFRATANSADVFRHRTGIAIATSTSSSVTDSFAEIAKNSYVLQPVEVIVQPEKVEVFAPVGAHS